MVGDSRGKGKTRQMKGKWCIKGIAEGNDMVMELQGK